MTAETALFWMAAVGYAAATLLYAVGLAFTRERLVSAGYWTAVVAFAAQTGSIVARWASTGRLPYVQDFENALSGTWAIAGVFLVVTALWPRIRVAGIGVAPLILLTRWYGITLPAEPGPVTPAYKSAWLVIHVLFAWATYAGYTSAAALAIVELMKSRRGGVKPGSPLERAPDADRLSDITFRLVAFGFVVNIAMIASGAIWAYELWGSYWRWDPVETWSLLTWLAFGFYMHARLTLGWRGPKLAWIAVLALFGVMMSFWGVQFAPSSYHLFRDLGSGVDLGRGR